ncbi:MAG: peptide chain release factor N(5)-glutamine methyltransferase [Candidatus Eisenbacteria bacterium]
MLISEYLSLAASSLFSAGIESARLEAEILLATATGVTRERLIATADRSLNGEEVRRAGELLALRATRYPLQYITGRVEFLDEEFLVRPGVFVPRPETEFLVLEAEKLLAAPTAPPPLIVDVGTGTGVIAVSLAVRSRRARLHAIDVSPKALELARANAERHGVAGRISFHLCRVVGSDCGGRGDAEGFSGAERGRDVDSFFGMDRSILGEGVDMIVSNPPYVPSEEIAGLSPEISRFEPREALDGGPGGLKYVRLLVQQSLSLLRPGGWLLLEIGAGQARSASEAALGVGYAEVRTTKDFAGIERVLKARKL